MADWNRSIAAVEWALEVPVGLKLTEVGQYVFPTPADGAEPLPAVVIRRRAAHGDLAIDARSPAHHPCLLVLRRSGRVRRVVRDGLELHLEIGPAVGGVHVGISGIAVGDVVRYFAGRRVAAGLDE